MQRATRPSVRKSRAKAGSGGSNAARQEPEKIEELNGVLKCAAIR